MRYCEYTFYEETWGGTMPETTFIRLSIEASMYIKRHTFGRIDEDDIPEEVQYCTCAIVDAMQEIEKRTGKSSETVGSWSVSYQDSEDDDSNLYDILTNYLLDVKTSDGNSILYRGC